MCGFLGFTGSRPPLDLGAGEAWIGRRGPDSVGTWSAAEGYVHVQHARLSISDLRPAAMQPMSDAESGLTIAFNGEIYNHLELRNSLAEEFRTDSDSETLLKLFKQLGTRALPMLRGMFAIALFDERNRRVLLMRDPVGKKPLFLLRRPEGTYFGSSVLALSVASNHTEIVDDAASQWWELGHTPADRSLLRDCRPVLPGEVVELDWSGAIRSRLRVTPAERQSNAHISLPEAVDELEGLVRTAVRRRLSDNPNPVALLSGGIDSTIVCKFALEENQLRLLTFTPTLFKSKDTRYAREAAKRLGAALDVLHLRLERIGASVERALELQDEPLATIAFVPLALMAAQACVGSRVLLTGDGGDEVFGGYGRPRDWIAEEPFQSDGLQSGPALPSWMSAYARRAAGADLVGHGFTKVDRATAEQALEARCPLLDWDVQAFARSLPPEIFFPGTTSKPLAKALLRGWPASFLERPKAGFPFRLRGVWALSLYAGLRERIDSNAMARFDAYLPPALRRPPQEWSQLQIAQNFTAAFKLYAWSVFTSRLRAGKPASSTANVTAAKSATTRESPQRWVMRGEYFISSAAARSIRRSSMCPSCGCHELSRVDRKYVVATLERCRQCGLMFRLPRRKDETSIYLRERYRSGMSTSFPDAVTLERWKRESFKGTAKDASNSLELLSALGCHPASTHILDFGCSWGYTSWQFQAAGYRTTGFEPVQSKCNFALTRMGIAAFSSQTDLQGPYDVFFCSHVLEHVPDVGKTLALARTLVRPGGWIVFLTPNGSAASRTASPERWSKAWGNVHPNFLDDEFYKVAAGEGPLLLASNPYNSDAVRRWAVCPSGRAVIGDLSGEELLAVMAG